MLFDTDSFVIGIDNCASKCLTDNRRDFVGPLQRQTTQVKGIGGNQKSQWVGTVKWPIIDDEGRTHELHIPNTVLVPEGSHPFRLLSPQHFAQENYAQGVDKTPRGTLSLTSGLDHILSWADKQFTITAPLTTGSNIALINSNAGYNKFTSFVNHVTASDEPVALFGHHMIPDDDDDDDHNAAEPTTLSNTLFDHDEDITPIKTPTNEGANEGDKHEGGGTPTSATNTQPHVISFLPGENCMPVVEETEDEESKLNNPTHELLLYNYRLGH
jgi:hypothetical protein